MMRIADAQVIVCSPGRAFVTLKLTTSDGLVGWGDATVNGRELSVASYLRDHVAPLLVGRDARRIEDTWHYLATGAYWRRGPITMAAVAAVDMALWDLKAKAAGVPLYQMLGGASRDRIRAYAHAFGRDRAELIESVQRWTDQGFTAVRAQCGIEGLASAYGISVEGAARYEPANGTRPVEEQWDTAAYLRQIPGILGAVREAVGPAVDLLHDAHHRLTPIEAANLGKSVEDLGLYWLEDVTPVENVESLKLVRQHTSVPLAVGEVVNSFYDYLPLLREQQIDFVRSAVTHVGGISAIRRLGELAYVNQIRMAPHGPTDISPIGIAASLHYDMAVHNFGIQEYMERPEVTSEAFPHAYELNEGFFYPGEAPGLGVELDESIAARYPYEPAYLPVNRLLDGTMHSW